MNSTFTFTINLAIQKTPIIIIIRQSEIYESWIILNRCSYTVHFLSVTFLVVLAEPWCKMALSIYEILDLDICINVMKYFKFSGILFIGFIKNIIKMSLFLKFSRTNFQWIHIVYILLRVTPS